MRGGPLVASFPVARDDQVMLATSTVSRALAVLVYGGRKNLKSIAI